MASPPPPINGRLDGRDLPGATNAELALAHLAPANAGAYTVLASNFAGTLISTVAVLRVEVP